MTNVITTKQIEQNKQTIITLLKGIEREGIDKLIGYLHESGFFTIPSSIDRHHNWRGGLAEHALGVYREAKEKYADLDGDSLIIACLLHDICKARQFYFDRYGRVRKNHHLHIHGHGYRSVKLLTEVIGMRLTEDERLAIRWHMGGHHCKPWDIVDRDAARHCELAIAVKHGDKQDAKHHPANNLRTFNIF